jgi:Tfp pilus assembly protein FimT
MTMNLTPGSRPTNPSVAQRGFTLVELLLVLVIYIRAIA